MTKHSYRSAFVHFTACIVFLSLPVISSPDFGTFSRMIQIQPFQRSFFEFFLLLAFFYANFFLLIPKIYYPKKYVLYGICLLLCYFLIEMLPDLIFPGHEFPGHGMMPPMEGHMRPPNGGFHLKSILQFSAIFFLTLLLRTNRQLRNAEREKLKAEVSYLKAQINPHFLFNTLNSLYALTIEKSDAAPDAVIKLSNMMRYVVTESTNDFVPLDKELAYLSDYIDLQRLRISDEPNLVFAVSGASKGKKIAPLVLIPFIENAFKYGVNAEEDWHIAIHINITHSELVLDVKNNKVKVNFPEAHVSEKGIENTRKRLDFIYPGDHELIVEDQRDTFHVHLKIKLS